MIIGITGGTGCGKTTALKVIEALGGTVLDCDAIYHELLQTDDALLAAIEARFPGTVTDGTLNRKKLGGIVFSDPDALLALNRITHSAVKQAVCDRLPSPPALAAIDAIELFEGGLAELCQLTVAIVAPEEIRIQRLMARDNITEAYARSRINAQHREAYFRQKCDHVLENNGTPEEFRAQFLTFLKSLGILKENSEGEFV